MAKIVIVDDEREIVELISVYLDNAGYEVLPFTDPRQALAADLAGADLAVLDVMMPGLDGFTLCSKLREAGHTFPVIMLTAKDGDGDKINGLALGADDYMVKPFNPLELMARIAAQLRRTNRYSGRGRQEEGVIDIGGLQVSESAHTCTLYGEEIELTPTEFNILLLLCKHRGKVMSSEQIFESVWGERYLDSNNTVMVHVQKLRRKLGDTDKRKKYIQTVWGVGYKIEE